MLGKRIAWIFVLSVCAAITSLVLFVQSAKFAVLAKNEIRKHVTPTVGVNIEFDRLKVSFFPPGLALSNVQVEATEKKNKIGLPNGKTLRAEKLGITFRMLQAFGAGITINKVFLTGAELYVRFDERGMTQKTGAVKSSSHLSDLILQPISFPISESFFVKILQFEIRDSRLDLKVKDGENNFSLQVNKIQQISLTPDAGTAGLLVGLEGVHADYGSEPIFVDAFRANISVSRKFIQLQTLDVQRGEIVANVQGRLLGGVDNLDQADADLKLLVRARAEALEEFTSGTNGLKGVIEGSFAVQGTRKDYKIFGNLVGTDVIYSDWAFDEVKVQASLSPKTLELQELLFKKNQGSVTLGEFTVPIGFSNLDKSIKLSFKNMDFHTFAGDLRKSINSLEANVNGTANISLSLVRSSTGGLAAKKIDSHFDLDVSGFELNNQLYGKQRPLRRILNLKTAKLQVNASLEGDKIVLRDTQIGLPTGKVDITGGVSTAGVFDLTGKSSDVDWGADVGSISEIPFKGNGPITLHVHGPGDNVMLDFDASLKDCAFINMNFGNLTGSVVLDDKESLLLIKNVSAQKNQSNYTVDGKVFLDSSNKISLRTSFPGIAPDDIFSIFEHQLSGMTWIPHGMLGLVSGMATIEGDYGNDGQNLVISALLRGERLSYMGESVQELSTNAGFDHGNYFANKIRAKKFNSQIEGELAYSKTGILKYRLVANNGKVRDLDYLASRGFPVDGLMTIQSHGEGVVNAMVSHTSVDITDAHLQTKALPALNFTWDTAEGRSKLIANTADGAIRLALDVASDIGHANSSLNIAINDSDLDFVLCAFNKNLCNDPAADLGFSAQLSSKWQGRAWEKMSGGGEIRQLSLQKTGFSLSLQQPAQLSLNEGKYNTAPIELMGPASKIKLSVSGDMKDGTLKNGLSGESSLKIIEFITPLIEEAQGRIKLNANISGTTRATRFDGGVNLRDGFLRLKGVDATIENLNGDIGLSGDQAELSEMRGSLGGGQIQVSGGVELYLNRPPIFNIELYGRDNRLKFFPVSYAEVEEAQLSFTGDHPPYLFGGQAKIRKTLMRNNFDMSGGQKQLQNARYLPSKKGDGSSFYEVKIHAVAEQGVFVENDLFDAEFRGDITLLNNFEYPEIIGKAELIKGRLLFRSTAFILDHAIVKLPSPEIFRPQFSVGGSTIVNNYKISLFASGTPDEPKISFSSSPPLSQGDILSLLAFGFKGEDTKGVRQDDLSAITYSEVGSILLEQLRISKDLQSRGFKVNVVPTVSDNEANIVRPKSASDSASPKIVVQTQVAKNLEASMGATLGTAQSQELGGGLEYYLGRRASVSGVFEQSQSVDETAPKSSYGADLKFRWGFK